MSLGEDAAERAVQRLAETLAIDVRLVDMPLYRLLSVSIHKGKIGGSVCLARFVEYVLTVDLLEGELVDALAADVTLGVACCRCVTGTYPTSRLSSTSPTDCVRAARSPCVRSYARPAHTGEERTIFF